MTSSLVGDTLKHDPSFVFTSIERSKNRTTYRFRHVNDYHDDETQRSSSIDVCVGRDFTGDDVIYISRCCVVKNMFVQYTSTNATLFGDDVMTFLHDKRKRREVYDEAFSTVFTYNVEDADKYPKRRRETLQMIERIIYLHYKDIPATKIQSIVKGWLCRRRHNLKKKRVMRELRFLPPVTSSFPGGIEYQEAKERFETCSRAT